MIVDERQTNVRTYVRTVELILQGTKSTYVSE